MLKHFFENTYQVEMESLYAPISKIFAGTGIDPDLGCGSGAGHFGI